MLLKLENYLRNGIPIFGMLFSLFSRKALKDEFAAAMILIFAVIVYMVLLYRNRKRNKQQGESVDKWELFYFWFLVIVMMLGVIMFAMDFYLDLV